MRQRQSQVMALKGSGTESISQSILEWKELSNEKVYDSGAG